MVDQWFARYDAEEIVDIISDSKTEQRIYRELNNRIINARKPVALYQLWPNSIWLKAACYVSVFCLVAGLFYRYQYNVENTTVPKIYHQVNSDNAQVKKIKLPDGTEIWLNAATQIRFATSFQHDLQRIVYLDKGEAFFKVRHNQERPFSVISGSIVTRDIGTAFNIRAYDLRNDYRVAVASGEVRVERTAKAGNSDILSTQLRAGDALFYNPDTRQTQITKKDISSINAWHTQGTLYFDEMTIVQIGQEISRHFNTDVIINKPERCKRRYTINAANESLTEVLQQLTLVTGISYKLDSNQLTINAPK